jgi:hypothetical protein
LNDRLSQKENASLKTESHGEVPMKLFTVLLMLAGFMVAQTKPLSEAVATPKPATINLGIDLQLGMSRDAIIPPLSARYKVDKIQGSNDEWIVEEKEALRMTIGHLEFTAGKLSYASRIGTQGQGDNYTFAQALWGVMSQMEREDQHACSFEVPATRSPSAEMSYFRLYCGPKTIDITAINVLSGTAARHYTSIAEVLSSQDSP